MTTRNERIYSDVVLKLGSKVFAGITSFDFQMNINMIATTNMNTANRGTTYKAGRINRTIQIEGIHDPEDSSPTTNDFWALEALAQSGAPATLLVGDVTEPGKYLTMSGLISNLSFKTQDDSVVNISASFNGTGYRTLVVLS
jgi:hypothetical protein